VSDIAVTGAGGVRPSLYVERVDETLERILAHGGTVILEPYPEGDLWVATFRDPAGNVLGVWQRGPRG
jgi:predicted enzyme related to lactoylglutathione lyase